MAKVRSSATSLIVLNILDTCKKTYFIENSSTETEADYQWMHGAYIHVTGRMLRRNAERSITMPRYSNYQI